MRMSGDSQVIVGMTVTGMGLLVALIGWLLVRRRLQEDPREPVTVVAKYTTLPARWNEFEGFGVPRKDHWVSVLRGTVDEKVALARSQDAIAVGRLVSIRVPGRVYDEARPGTRLDVVPNETGFLHPYFRVRWLIWCFGGLAAVLLVNGVSLFFIEEAVVPSWLQWTGLR